MLKRDGPSIWPDNVSSKWTDQTKTKSAMWTEYNGLLNKFQTTIESIKKVSINKQTKSPEGKCFNTLKRGRIVLNIDK